jgi:hypothetical protein
MPRSWDQRRVAPPSGHGDAGSRFSIRGVHETNKKRRSVALPPTLLRLITTKQRPAAQPAFVFLRESRNYFLGAIASFAALATRNFTTVFALI